MSDREKEDKPAAVSEEAKQAGEIRARWAWVEPSVWTERMLTALEEGIKGGKWFSLMDKIYAERTLGRASSRSKPTEGAGGVDRQTVEDFERDWMKNLERLSENCGREATDRRRYDGCGYRSRGVRKSGRWGSRRFGIGWCKRRCGWCWNRSLSGTLPSRATDSDPTGGARMPCGGWTGC